MYYLKEIRLNRTSKYLKIMSHQENELDECPICGDEFTENNDKFTLSCKHTYHKECIMLEVESSSKNNVYRCPYCRTTIDNVPLFSNQIPIKNVHKEYKKYENQYVPFSKFKQFLDIDIVNTKSRCCSLVFSSHSKNNNNQDTFFIVDSTRQCNRRKMRNNDYYCSIHNKKYGDIDLSKTVYYFP